MDIHIDEKNIVSAGPTRRGYILELDTDGSLMDHLSNLLLTGLFGETIADVAIYLIRTGLERLVTARILELDAGQSDPNEV